MTDRCKFAMAVVGSFQLRFFSMMYVRCTSASQSRKGGEASRAERGGEPTDVVRLMLACSVRRYRIPSRRAFRSACAVVISVGASVLLSAQLVLMVIYTHRMIPFRASSVNSV